MGKQYVIVIHFVRLMKKEMDHQYAFVNLQLPKCYFVLDFGRLFFEFVI
jgi:hypothetical protein